LRALSYGYWGLIGVTCPVFFVGAVVIWVLTVAVDRRLVVLHLYSCAWATFYVKINPLWKLRVSGRDHLPWRGPAVIVANHASLIDILVLFDLFRPFKWVSKAENFKIPFVGWNMRLNRYVPLVRGDRESVVAMLAECDGLLAAGSPVLFFPEGTRTKDGALQPFKDGAFELAVKHGVPLIPVAVHGTRSALPKHGMVLQEQVDAHVEILAPLTPGDDVGALRDAARAAIAGALG
jgi:1-acyl-sn-glycerol-3-phosphate acyltransferase